MDVLRRAAVLLSLASVCMVTAQGPPETPLNMSDCTATVAGTLAVTGGLEELSKLVGNVSLQVPTLSASDKSVTLFAPSNSAIGAFQAALSGAHPTISQTQMQTVLAQIVRYHMLPTAMNTANMSVGDVLETSLAGHKITVTAITPRVTLQGDASGSTAHINQPNIVVCNSIMHVIDAVLLPVPMNEVAAGELTAATPAPAPAAAARSATTATHKPTVRGPATPKPATTKPSSAKPVAHNPVAIAHNPANGTSMPAKTITQKPATPTAQKPAKPTAQKPAKPTAKKPAKPTAATVTKNKPGLPVAGDRKGQLDATSATDTNKTSSVAPAPAPGAAPRGATAGALCLMVAAVGCFLLLE